MEEIDALADQQAELSELVSSLDDAGWARPSRCDGWTIADVVLHLAQTNEMAIASLEDRFMGYLEEVGAAVAPASSVDDAADLVVRHERGAPGAAVRDRWQASVDRMHKLFSGSDPSRRVVWVAGELAVRTLATTRLTETWIHTGDVAAGLGVDLAPTDRLRHTARLAWRTVPYAFARSGRELAGPVAFVLRAPGGDTWSFTPDGPASTTITGTALELCLVAGQRADAADTGLRGTGPDADAVLELVRTYA